MIASGSISLTQHFIFWILLSLLLGWMVIFAWLAFRPVTEEKRSEVEESPVYVKTFSMPVSTVPAELQVMVAQPAPTPVGAVAASHEKYR